MFECQSVVGGTVLGDVGGVALLKKCITRGGLWILKALHHSQCTLFPPCGSRRESSASYLCHHACCLLLQTYPSGSVSPINSSLSCLGRGILSQQQKSNLYTAILSFCSPFQISPCFMVIAQFVGAEGHPPYIDTTVWSEAQGSSSQS